MIKYYCDRCGKECGYNHVNVHVFGKNYDNLIEDFCDNLLCIDCAKELKNWIKKDE